MAVVSDGGVEGSDVVASCPGVTSVDVGVEDVGGNVGIVDNAPSPLLQPAANAPSTAPATAVRTLNTAPRPAAERRR